MLNGGSKAHMCGLCLNGYMIQKGKIQKCFGQEKKELPKSPLELLPFELGHFRLNKELKKANGKFELHAQFTLYSTVLEICTLGARDFSSTVSGFCQIFIVTSVKSLRSRALITLMAPIQLLAQLNQLVQILNKMADWLLTTT